MKVKVNHLPSALISTSRFLILGLGRAGKASARALLQAGAKVYGFDSSAEVWQEGAVQELIKDGLIPTRIPAKLRVDWVIASPGFSEKHPLIQNFRKKGVLVVDELDFASRFLPGEVIAVTGTNGKSTTVSLIANILKSAQEKVFLGGNLAPGKPLTTALLLPAKEYYVVEVSSFQLERARWLAPKVAVILNITHDHLDRHFSFERYVGIKARLLDLMGTDDWVVLNYDDEVVRGLAERGKSEKVFFSASRRVPGAFLAQGWFCFSRPGEAQPPERVARLSDLRLWGRHNIENALAAVCVARLLRIPKWAIRHGLRGFSGLAHRLELVRQLRGVKYINNSMCTNPVSGIQSLQAVAGECGKEKIILITGGKEKGLPVDGYLQTVTNLVKWVILIGENRGSLAQGLRKLGFNRFEIIDNKRTGRQVVRLAVQSAQKRVEFGDTVLFSPAFASFDMFADFQERGKAFKDAVKKLR